MFEPDDENLTALFPDERIVYLKFAVTISPFTISGSPPVAGLGEGTPCYHMLLDLTVRKPSGASGTIRPYFHSAAPLHRSMIQTGIVGNEVFEGESDAQFMGKSGSQMFESSTSRSRTRSMSAGASFGYGGFSIGGSVRNTTTDVSANREVSQFMDTTQRQASEERRQLISHMTRVENVLTLLNAKYVGTPHLRFSLSPQPLQLLSLDPSDPNLWFSQLLQRRSSGIEGIQEFTTVVLVPRDEDFCVNADLTRVCVLDDPPGPLTFEERFNFNQHHWRLLNYLERVYPPGTPLEELDIDVAGFLDADTFPRPVVEYWAVGAAGTMYLGIISPTQGPQSVSRTVVNYKHDLEVWLETLRDEYERDVARSPLERGVFIGEHRVLDTCISFLVAGRFTVRSSSTSVSPLFRIDVDPAVIDHGGVAAKTSSARISIRDRAFEAITRWNLLEERLAKVLANRRTLTKGNKIRFDDEGIVRTVINRWAKLNSNDPLNLSLDSAIEILELSAAHRRLLTAAGVKDLRGIAQIINAAQVVDHYNSEAGKLRKLVIAARAVTLRKGAQAKVKRQVKRSIAATTVVEPIRPAISLKDSIDIRRAVGRALEKNFNRLTEE